MVPRRCVSATRTIAAPASAIFALLADPSTHATFDGSGTLQTVKDAPDRLFLGAKFSMNMKIGVAYLTRNVVVDFVENRSIAWHHFARLVWRYDLEPVEDGTKVTESFTYNNVAGRLIALIGYPERNRQSMEATLERIEKIVTSSH